MKKHVIVNANQKPIDPKLFINSFKVKIHNKYIATKEKFRTNPWQYISIPIVAALVGYITNYLGVAMLFYPIEWRGATKILLLL